MPIGYLVTVIFIAVCTFLAVAPPRPARTSPTSWSFRFGFLPSEQPFVVFAWLAASTALAFAEGDVESPAAWAAVGVAVATTAGLVVLVLRSLRAGPVVEQALRDGLGADWRDGLGATRWGARDGTAPHPRRRLPLGRILLAPFLVRRRSVRRVANISYGDAGRRNRLDVYRHRSRPSGGPVLVHLHGGGFRSGRKDKEARVLLYRLADQGWLCVSANYRLRPGAVFPDHLVDVKKVIAWVRTHAPEHGADPRLLFVAGSSAGGHLASCAALTPNDPAFQPGFEDVDTSVTAAVSLYGYYGSVDSRGEAPSSPLDHVGAAAPPFLVAHGDRDTIVRVEDARQFVERLRATSRNPVVYAELPGAQHVFDLFHSLRFDTLVGAIEAFAAWVLARSATAQVEPDDPSPPGRRGRGRG